MSRIHFDRDVLDIELGPGWQKYVDTLPMAPMTLTVDTLVSQHAQGSIAGDSLTMTAAARDETEGETLRIELAAGKCQTSWRNYPHATTHPDSDAYRQHRCERELRHRGVCRCRYCGRDRSAA